MHLDAAVVLLWYTQIIFGIKPTGTESELGSRNFMKGLHQLYIWSWHIAIKNINKVQSIDN